MSKLKREMWNYTVAIALVLVALLLLLILDPFIQMAQTSYLLFFAAVLGSAWYGGRKAGVLATLTSVLLANYFFIEPRYSLDLSLANGVKVAIFMAQGILISFLVGALRTVQQDNQHCLNLQKLALNEQQAALQERDRINLALRQSEERYRMVGELIPFGVWEADSQGNTTYLSPLYLEMLGCTLEELRQTWQALLHPDDLQPYSAAWAECVQSQRLWEHEFRIRGRDGRYRTILSRGLPVRDNAGNITAYVGTNSDLTDRKQVEEELRLNRDRLALVLQTTGIGLWLNPLPLTRLNWDERTRELFFIPPDAEPTIDLFWSRVHPEEHELTRLGMEAALREGTLYAVDHRVVHPVTGEIRWIRSAGKATYTADGTPTRFDGINYDISDRKVAELEIQRLNRDLMRQTNKLQTILEALPVGVAIAQDPECNVIHTNRFLQEMLTMPPGANVSATGEHSADRPFRETRNGVDIPGNELPMQLAVAQKQEVREVQIQMMRSDGAMFDWWVNAVPLFDERGNVSGCVAAVMDITELRRAEAALRDSEQRFRRLVESNMFGVAFGDFSGGIHYANDYFLNMIGYTREEIEAGQVRWTDLTPDEFLPLDAQAMAELRTNGVATFFEKEYIRKDGTHVPILLGSALVREPYDQEQEIIGFLLDLTEQRQAEKALSRSEARLQLALTAGQMGTWDWNLHTNKIVWSEGHFRLLGIESYNQEPTYELWASRVHPDDLPMIREILGQSRQTNDEYQVEYRVIHDDGSIRWINAKGLFYLDANEEPYRMLGIAADITARKKVEIALRKSEERFRFATRAVNGIIYDLDVETGYVYRSEGLYQLIGIHSEAASPIATWWAQRIHPEDQSVVDFDWNSIVINGSNDTGDMPPDYYSVEYRVRHADGHWVDVWDRGYLIRDEEGHVIRVVGSTVDISDRIQIERTREQILQQEQATREKAEQANRIKDEFLAVLSHELRSPLNPILGWSKLLKTGKLSTVKTAEAIATIERNAKLQSELIEDLLDVSRILRGKLSLNISSVNLGTTIQAAIETVRLAAEAKLITLVTNFASDIGPVSGDATRLQQVVWNLLSNAVKFTPTGGRVEVKLEQISTPPLLHPYAQITVSDNGRGIPAHFLPHVFEYFRQEDGATTRKFGGLGLGLAIVRQIVELHGGIISAESQGEDRGATFTVQLPLLSTPDLMKSELNPALSLDLRDVRILVVDDEADSRELTVFMIEQAGASVSVATSAIEAIDALMDTPFDVLLSDIGMPNMDGYMLLQQVRSLPPEHNGQIKAIALTAYAGDFNRQQALEAGFQHHIAKPVELEDLIQAIAELISQN
jgi:PAS domain S-box-containing protein